MVVGSTVKVGKVVEGKRTYLSGAPRSDLGNGEVLMFLEGTNNRLTIQGRHRLAGDQFGCGFGTALEIVDVNADG